MLNKVPEVVLLFWVVKLLSTTVGETAADFLADNVGLGLTTTSFIMAALLAVALVVQFRTRRYVPVVYWLVVVLISVVGTLISDNLVDNFGVSLWTTTFVFGAWLWRSPSSLGTAASTLCRSTRSSPAGARPSTGSPSSSPSRSAPALATWSPSSSGSGYLTALLIFGSLIALVFIAFRLGGLNAVLAFWPAYILTRPARGLVG